MKIILTSGGFDPLHMGHVRLFMGCKDLGGRVIAIVNTDEWLTRKKGKPFMPLNERLGIVNALRYVDHVWIAKDDDDTVCETLRMARKLYNRDHLIFAKGGDRKVDNTPEKAVCEEIGIQVVYGVGGEKINSSSTLLRDWKE